MNGPHATPRLRFRPHENLGVKLISLALAIGLWSIVPDATVPHVVRSVPVRLRDIPADLALAEAFDAELEVWVRGAAVRTRSLLPGELSPRLDLADAFAGENTVIITAADIPTPLGVSVESIEPAQVRVVLEERVRAELPVNAVVEGSPASGYDIINRIVFPPTLTVAGPRSRVELLTALSTEVINVADREESLMREVAVLTDDPLVDVEGGGRAQLTIQIEETPVVLEISAVPVRILNATYRVVINPAEIGVVLRGPPGAIAELTGENLIATIDVAGLAPRAEDYRIEPRITFDPPDVGARLAVLTLTPQRRLDVHVFDSPVTAADR